MTAQANDWAAMSGELLAIKAEAYDEGLQDAKKALETDYRKLQDDADKTMSLRKQWNEVVSMAKTAYLTNTGKYMKVDAKAAENMPYWDDENRLSVPADNEEFTTELHRLVKMGRDFEILLKGCQKNALVKAQWDRMMVALRMTDE